MSKRQDIAQKLGANRRIKSLGLDTSKILELLYIAEAEGYVMVKFEETSEYKRGA